MAFNWWSRRGEDKRLILLNLKQNKKTYLKGHKNNVFCCRFSPNGKWIASCDESGKLIIWDFKTRKKIHQLKRNGAIEHCYFAPDSKTLISAGFDEKITVWDVATGDQKQVFVGHTQGVNFCSINNDGKLFISTSRDTTLKLWRLKSLWPKVINTKREVKGCSLAPDNKTLFIAKNNAIAILHDIETNKKIKELKSATVARSGHFSPNGKTIVVSDAIIKTKIVDWEIDKELINCEADSIDARNYMSLLGWSTFNPMSSKIIAGMKLPYIYMWDIDFNNNSAKNFKILSFSGTFVGNQKPNTSITKYRRAIFSPDGKHILSPDPLLGGIRIWNANPSRRVSPPNDILPVPRKALSYRISSVSNNYLTFSKDGKYLLSNYGDVLVLWEWKSKKLKALFLEHSKEIAYCAFFNYKENKRFVSVDKQGILKIWETNAYSEEIDKDLGCKIIRRSLLSINAHSGRITALEISSDNQTIVTSSEDGTVKIWGLNQESK